MIMEMPPVTEEQPSTVELVLITHADPERIQAMLVHDPLIREAEARLAPYIEPDALVSQSLSRRSRRFGEKLVRNGSGAEHENELDDFILEHGADETLALWQEIASKDYPAYLKLSFIHFFEAARMSFESRVEQHTNPDSGAIAVPREKPTAAITEACLSDFDLVTASDVQKANLLELLAKLDPVTKAKNPQVVTLLRLMVLADNFDDSFGLQALLTEQPSDVYNQLFMRKMAESFRLEDKSVTEQIGFMATAFGLPIEQVVHHVADVEPALWPAAARLVLSTKVDELVLAAQRNYASLSDELAFFTKTAVDERDTRTHAAHLLRKTIEEYVAMATPRVSGNNLRTAQVVQIIKADVSGFKAFLQGERRSTKRARRTTTQKIDTSAVASEETEQEQRPLFVCTIQKSGEVVASDDSPETLLEEFQKKYRGNTGAIAAAERLMALLPSLDLSHMRRGIKQVDAGKNKGLKNDIGQEVKLYELKPSEAGIGGGNLMRRIRFLFTLHPDGSIGLVDFIHRDSYSEWLANHGMGNS